MKTLSFIFIAFLNIVGIYYLDFLKIQTPDQFTVSFVVFLIMLGTFLIIEVGIKEIHKNKISTGFMGILISLKILPAIYIFVQSFANRQFLFVYIYLCFILVSIFFSVRENKKPSPS
jgi:uncharacterized membrane protein YhaH (DUF805 family)